MQRLLILILLTPLLTGCADHFDMDRETPFALRAVFTPNRLDSSSPEIAAPALEPCQLELFPA